MQNANAATTPAPDHQGKPGKLNSERIPAAATMHQGQNSDRASAIMRTVALIVFPLGLKDVDKNLFQGQGLGGQRLRSMLLQSLHHLRSACAHHEIQFAT